MRQLKGCRKGLRGGGWRKVEKDGGRRKGSRAGGGGGEIRREIGIGRERVGRKGN